jgi:RimJ/RimL family protein N-acetyltransferase
MSAHVAAAGSRTASSVPTPQRWPSSWQTGRWRASRAGKRRTTVRLGSCYEIGLALLPEHRGHGLGTAAQRLLVDYLFKYTTAHRLEALTDTENIAEQKALERIGFKREGVMRGVFFQRGTWRDQAIYALLRDDQRGGP